MFHRNINHITYDEAYSLINSLEDNLLIIDLREPSEYNNSHIRNAINIPDFLLESKISKYIEFRSKPTLLYCEAGGKSSRATKELFIQGFTKIYNLRDGIIFWPYELESRELSLK